jgi:pyrimidine operon attenuation protein/uracil phosphoribosyltransferase
MHIRNNGFKFPFAKLTQRGSGMGNIHMVLDASDIEQILKQMTVKIIETHKRLDNLTLIGIHTRGVYLARRIQSQIQQSESVKLPIGDVDINLYRDDWTRIGPQPIVRKSDIAFNVDDKQIILIDDVLFTGRTVRAAMDALIDFGRPARIELAVLIDRGHRELPIQANYIGKTIKTTINEAVNVLLKEFDDIDRVDILPGKSYGPART